MKMPIFNGKDLIGIAQIDEVAFSNIITLVQNGCMPKIDVRETGSEKMPYELHIQSMPFISKYKHEEVELKKEKAAEEEMDNSIDGLSIED